MIMIETKLIGKMNIYNSFVKKGRILNNHKKIQKPINWDSDIINKWKNDYMEHLTSIMGHFVRQLETSNIKYVLLLPG